MFTKTAGLFNIFFCLYFFNVAAQNNDLKNCLYEINPTETERMINAYKQYFSNDGLINDFFIPKCAIKAMADFVNANPNTITGIRFFWGSKGNIIGLNHKSRLIIVATKKAAVPPAPGEKYPNDFKLSINEPANCSLPSNVFWAYKNNDAVKWIDNFGEKFRKEPTRGKRENAAKDPLSLAVWLSSCKILAIDSILQANSNLDGINASCAAYYKSDQMSDNNERPYAVQSTLVFTPTVNGTVQWNILATIPGLINLKMKTLTSDSYNHGALCPNQCN